MSEPPLIYLIAGEPSGDLLGGRLMIALTALTGGEVRFAGIGGERMAIAGLDSLFPMSELSLMGIAEVLPQVPRLLRRIDQTVAEIRSLRPAVLVTIDAPSFTLRVARRLADDGIPRIHYVAPQVWAWRPGRAARLAGRIDRLMALLPFEPPFFTAHGLDCRYVGHPVLESGADQGDGARFRARHRVPAHAPLMAVLPGSRRSEVTRLLPIFGETVRRLVRGLPDLRIAVATVPGVAAQVAAAVQDWPGHPALVRDESEKHDLFAAADVALAASGTVALELAMARTPTIVAYRFSPLSWIAVKAMIKVRYAALPNIILDRMVVPELLQGDCRPDRLEEALRRLIANRAERTEQRVAADAVIDRLRGDADEAPSRRAARVVLESLRPKALSELS